jgi:hypothetical protein
LEGLNFFLQNRNIFLFCKYGQATPIALDNFLLADISGPLRSRKETLAGKEFPLM